MTTRKFLLNHLFEICGIAALNNLYSPQAKTNKGGLLFTRKLAKSYLFDGLIEKIEPIGKPLNKSREVFFCLTKRGSDYIGRSDEYRYWKYQKSTHNIMHESMKFVTALSLLRRFPRLRSSAGYS